MRYLKHAWIFVALAFALGIAYAQAASDQELIVYNWEDYLAPDTLDVFSARHGIKTTLKTFSDEDQVGGALIADPGAYDVAVLSDTLAQKLYKQGLLANLDHTKIPGLDNIDPRYYGRQSDPDNAFSVPYLWGTTGIVINRKHITQKDASWAILWNPAYKGHIAMLNNRDEVIGASLKYLGYSLNSGSPKELKAAQNKLNEQKPLLAGYLDPIAIRSGLIDGTYWAAQEYSGEAMSAIEKNPDLEYLIPFEGASLWVDCLVIPASSKHKEAAHAFINYIMDPRVNAGIANYLNYASCNKAAAAFTDKTILDNPHLYPPQDILDLCEFISLDDKQNTKDSEDYRNSTWKALSAKN